MRGGTRMITGEQLSDMMGRMARPAAARPLPEAQVIQLREAMARMDEPLPSLGDLVTIMAGCGLIPDLAGQPMLICEISDHDNQMICSNPRHVHGHRENIRCLYLDGDGDVTPVWLEHWQVEPWRPAGGSQA